jgi:hypothetical protein
VRRGRAWRDDANVPEKTVASQQFKLEQSFEGRHSREMAVDLQCEMKRAAQGDLGISQRHVSNRVDATVLNGDKPG